MKSSTRQWWRALIMVELVGLAVAGCGEPAPRVAPDQLGRSGDERAGDVGGRGATQTETGAASGEAGSASGEAGLEIGAASGEARLETGSSEGSELAPVEGRVAARVLDFRANADRDQIKRLVRDLAVSCYRRELLRSPGAAGRLVLEFVLFGDRKGPPHLKIEGEQELPKLASCLRQRMAAARWPTGLIDGAGRVTIRLDFALVDE